MALQPWNPCMAVTASDFLGGALEYTHTTKDNMDIVNLELIEQTAEYVASLIDVYSKRR